MKKNSYSLLFFLVVIFIFSSFKTSGIDDNDLQSSSLVGTWQFSKVGVVENGRELLESWDGIPECKTEHIIFKADQTGASVEYDEWDGDCEELKTPFEWSLTGEMLKFGSQGDFSEVQVVELTGRVLKIYEEDQWNGETVVSVLLFTRI